jgi:ATP-dependent Clp protease adaptor protein ClpS
MEESKRREEGAAIKPKSAARRKHLHRRKPRLRKLPPFNVVLLDDDDHTVDYVVEMLRRLFGYPEEQGGGMVKTLDSAGRVVVYTTHKELAELKREQIIGYGADWRLQRSKGPMRAVVEPAPEV